MTPSESAASTAVQTVPPGERLLRLPAVLDVTGRGRTAWLDDVKAGKAPKPIKIGAATFWLWTEVQRYIADRIHESRGA